MCVLDCDESPEVWLETERKARKEHICSSCCRVVDAGEKYLAHFSVYDGRSWIGKLCCDCVSDRAKFAEAHGGILCFPSELRNVLVDCIAEGDDESEMWRSMLDRIKARGLAVAGVSHAPSRPRDSGTN